MMKDKTPTSSISVIIPTYNRQNLIARCLKSILKQTIIPSEVILVDDNSDDSTIDVALTTYPKLNVIRHDSRRGAQAARAAGVQAATGEWIAFLDSDDWWLPNKLELQLKKAEEGMSVIHGAALISIGGQNAFFEIPPLEGSCFMRLLQRPGPMYQSLMVKRSCFDVVGFPDPTISAYQEWDMSLSLAKHFTFGFVPQPLFVYEVQNDSISKDNYRGLRGYEQIVNKWMKDILTHAGKDAVAEHFRFMATQARQLSGAIGFAHYTMLGAKITNRSPYRALASEAFRIAKNRLGLQK